MRCPQCEIRNPIGNKFCRECGSKLPVPKNILYEEESARAEAERNQERAARLLTDAFTFSDQGKVDQAILLAAEAAELMPKSASAQSLLASLYDRSGQREKAITAMERVVAIKPGSVADREALLRLKAGGPLHAASAYRPTVAVAPASASNAWMPAVAAGMIGALVLGAGLSLLGRRPAATTRVPAAGASAATASTAVATARSGDGSAASAPPASSGGITMSLGGNGMPKVNTAPPAGAGADPFSPLGRGAAAGATTQAGLAGSGTEAALSSIAAGRPSGPGSKSLPPLNFHSGAVPPAPVKLIGVPTDSSSASRSTADSGAANRAFGDGGRISATAPSSNDGSGVTIAAAPPSAAAADVDAASAAPQQPRGYISISVHSPRGGDSGANGDVQSGPVEIPVRSPQNGNGNGGGGGDPMTRALSLQGSGRYREAIGAYRSALSANSDSGGAAYQGIALSHQRLGEDAAARAAYQQAIAAYQAQATAGHDPEGAQRGIASCRAAMEVLGGG